MYVKYKGQADERIIRRADLGKEGVREDEHLVFNALNLFVQEMTQGEYERLRQLTPRGDWQEVEKPADEDYPSISMYVIDDQSSDEGDVQEASVPLQSEGNTPHA